MLVFSLLVFICGQLLIAKEIIFRLPSKALQSFTFYTYNGSRMDTLYQGKTDFAGNGEINLKNGYDTILFMGVLSFQDNDAMDLIVAEGDFSFAEDNGRLIFLNSHENDLFYNRKNDVINTENADTFVQKYLFLMAALLNLNQILEDDLYMNESVENTRLSALEYINLDILYYTKFWNLAIDVFFETSPNMAAFIADMKKLLDKSNDENAHDQFLKDFMLVD